MKKGELISSRMIKEHGKMIVLMDKIKKGDMGVIKELKDILSRHAFAEEKAIMAFYSRKYKSKRELKLLSTILEQHEELRGYLGELESDKKVLKNFNKLMNKHIKLEDSKFYPKLDNDLTPKEQDEMFKEFMVLFNQKVKF